MRSVVALGLLGYALQTHAHPASFVNPKPYAHLSRRAVDLNKFRLPQTAQYVDATKTVNDPVISIVKRDTYVETATELVKSIVPGATFRLVGDHYVGTNGIAHVNFKQTAHGLDIDNADFHVNVGHLSLSYRRRK
jgi:extracellular elastinolytic metalloproteinase